MGFAKTFYLHYPKVGLGHWGPTFYLVQGLWEQVFGPFRVSVLMLQAVLTSLLATSVYAVIPRPVPRLLAFCFALCLPCSAVFQRHTASIMTEPLLALMVFWAVLCWGRFLDSEKTRHAIAFGIFATLAILTKGNGLLLALVPGLATLMAAKLRLLATWRFWWPALLVVVVCAPWFFLTSMMQTTGMYSDSTKTDYLGKAVRYYLLVTPSLVGNLTVVLAVLGVLFWQIRVRARWGCDCQLIAMASLVLAALVFHMLVPIGLEGRYLSVIVAPLLVFASLGMECLVTVLTGRVLPRAVVIPLVSAVAFIAFVCQAGWGHAAANGGFARLLDDLDRSFPYKKAGMLVASDELGEGMFVAQVAERDDRPNRYAVRASKVLTYSGWGRESYRLRFKSADQVASWLQLTRIGIVVLDTSTRGQSAERQQLQEAIALHPSRWELMGSYDLVREGQNAPGSLVAYRQLGVPSYVATNLELNMQQMMGDSIRQQELEE